MPDASPVVVGAVPEIIPSYPEPDVTWGVGGIDDFGWTAVVRRDKVVSPPLEQR